MRKKCGHGRRRTICRECKNLGTGGNSICPHDRQKNSCSLCGGREYCEHGRQACMCSLCSPKGFYRIYVRNECRKYGALPEFFIPFDLFCEMIKLPCCFCGATPNEANGMGLDRIDNSKGHLVGNVQPCCFVCNGMRSVLSQKVFLEKVRRISTFRFKENNASTT